MYSAPRLPDARLPIALAAYSSATIVCSMLLVDCFPFFLCECFVVRLACVSLFLGVSSL